MNNLKKELSGLPYDLLFIIFSKVHKLSRYITLNKYFSNVIRSIINYYENIFTRSYRDWMLNHVKLIEELIKNNNTEQLMFFINNYMEIINEFPDVIEYSIKYKNFKLLESIYKNIANLPIYNDCGLSFYAAKYKHNELAIKYITSCSLNATNFQDDLKYFLSTAIQSDDLDLLQKLPTIYIDSNINDLAIYCTFKDSIKVFEWLYNTGNVDINDEIMIKNIVYYNQEKILFFLLSKNEVDIQYYAILSSKYGNLDFIRLFKDEGFNDFYTLASYAIKYYLTYIVEYSLNNAIFSDIQIKSLIYQSILHKRPKILMKIITETNYTDYLDIFNKSLKLNYYKPIKILIRKKLISENYITDVINNAINSKKYKIILWFLKNDYISCEQISIYGIKEIENYCNELHKKRKTNKNYLPLITAINKSDVEYLSNIETSLIKKAVKYSLHYNMNIFNWLINHYSFTDYGYILKQAIHFNNIDIVKDIIEKKLVNNIYNYVLYAVKYNNLNALKLFISNGYYNFTEMSLFASQYDSIDIIKFILQNSLQYLSLILNGLCKYNQVSTLRNLMEKYQFSSEIIVTILVTSIKFDSLGTLKYIMKNFYDITRVTFNHDNKNNNNIILLNLVLSGNIKSLKFIATIGGLNSKNLETLIKYIIKQNNKKMFIWVYKNGFRIKNEKLMNFVVKYNNVSIARILIKLFDLDNLHLMLSIAIAYNNNVIGNLISDKLLSYQS